MLLPLRIALLQGVLACGLGLLDVWLTGGPGVLCLVVGLFIGALLSLGRTQPERTRLPQLALRVAVHHAVLGGAVYGLLVEVPAWWAPGAIGLLTGGAALVLTMVAGDAALHWFGEPETPAVPERLPPPRFD